MMYSRNLKRKADIQMRRSLNIIGLQENEVATSSNVEINHTIQSICSDVSAPKVSSYYVSCRTNSNNENQINNLPEINFNVYENDSDNNQAQKESLCLKLSKWAIEEQITQCALKKLLYILNSENVANLPKDPRTLLKTPSVTKSTVLDNGTYFYFGVEKMLNKFFLPHKDCLLDFDKIELAVNVDGLPMSKSTNSSLWPILCSVTNLECVKNKVFLVCLFHGEQKPSNLPNFLKDFVEECVYLSEYGLSINGNNYTFKIKMLILDTPAKSYMLQIKGHNGHFSCSRCVQEGDMFNGVVILDENDALLRSDRDFRNKIQPEHHIGVTPLERIPNFDLINDVPLDYMHLICLGVVKRLLTHKIYGWVHGKPPYKLRALSINKISSALQKLRQHIPLEFGRKTRSLNECKRYKATELRLFLLYTGPVVLKNVLSKRLYKNFLTLSVATSIMASSELSQDKRMLTYAHNLMKFFIKKSVKIYNLGFVSYNVHNLLHMKDCVERFGKLDNFSAFAFENYLQTLKRKVRKCHKILEQIVRRISEEASASFQAEKCHEMADKTKIVCMQEHNSGPLLQNCVSPQYKKIKYYDFCLSLKPADRFAVLMDGTVVEIVNFCYQYDHLALIGFAYEKRDFFFTPCKSSLLNIHIIKKTNNLQAWNLKLIKSKLMVLPHEDVQVSFPLLHLMPASWVVVHFAVDNTVECVPKIWYNGETQTCWFPKNLTSGKMYNLIRNSRPAQKDWVAYECTVLGEYDNFKVAQRKTEKARNSNFLSSVTEDSSFETSKGKRLKKKNPRYHDDSDDDDHQDSSDIDSSDDDSLKYPNPPKKQNVQAVAVRSSLMNSEGEVVDINSPSTSRTNTPPTSRTNTPLFTSNVPRNIPTPSLAVRNNVHSNISEFQRQVLKEILLIKNILKQHSENFTVLLASNQHETTQTITNEEFEQLTSLWPLTADTLDQFEMGISSDKSLEDLMIKELARMGGSDAAILTKRILYRVLTNEAGKLYSWEGAKGKKHFKSLKLATIILKAVRQNPATSSATDLTIIDSIKKWLVKAKARASKDNH